jgi:hypothetical protein
MSGGVSGENEQTPVESTRIEPTQWTEPAPPDYPGHADNAGAAAYPGAVPYPGADAYPGIGAFPAAGAQYPPPYPDLGTGASPAGYPPPVYPPYASYPQYGYPATRQTNTLAIVALVISFFFWPVGLVCGHIARRQIARSGESGRGLATAALVIGYLQLAFIALLILAGVASN